MTDNEAVKEDIEWNCRSGYDSDQQYCSRCGGVLSVIYEYHSELDGHIYSKVYGCSKCD